MNQSVTSKQNTTSKPRRDKSVELLRMVLMLMIIASHVNAHGGIEYNHFCVNSAFLSLFGLLGNLATNVFILVTGYYSLQSKFNYKKILRLIIVVTVYSIILNTISFILGNSEFSVDFLLKTLFPIFFGKGYWFIVRYLQLYLLIPLLNYGIRGIGRKMHLMLIILFGIMFSVWPSVNLLFTVQDFQFNTLVWFVWLYILGAYLKLYGSVFYQKKKLTGFLLAGSAVLCAVFAVIRNYYSFHEADNLLAKLIRKTARVLGDKSRNALLIVVISILLLIVFQKLKVKLSDRIYPVASSVFGIYILHDNSEFKNILWKTICGTTRMQDSVWFPLYAVVIVILIFAVCCAIDMLATKFVFKPLYKKIQLQ